MAAVGGEVDEHRAFVAHEVLVVRATEAEPAVGVGHADDVGAEVGQLAGAGRPGAGVREVDDADAGERPFAHAVISL